MTVHEARLISDPKTPLRFLVVCTCGWISGSDLPLVRAERQRKTHLEKEHGR